MKKITLLFTMLLIATFSWQAQAQPANDTAAGATPIIPSVAGTGCATFTFVNSTGGDGTTDSGLDGTCDTTDTGLDRFYTWTATSLALVYNDGAGNPGIVIREATTPYAEITCTSTFASADTQLSGWAMGQDLIIQIYDFATADVATSFCLEQFTPPPAPDCATNPSPVDAATGVVVGSITLTWDAPTSGPTPTSYDLYAGSLANGSDLSLVGNYTATTANVTINGFDTTIYWQIRPKNGSSEAVNCPLWSLTTASPPVGAICTDPIVVTAIPYNTTDNTNAYGDDYTGSPGATGCGTTSSYLNGDDVVYSYTATADGSINIAMTGIGNTYSGIFVYTDCADIGTTCANGMANSGSTDRVFDLAVVSGTTYYIVISTWAAPQSTTYTLDITENTCANPTVTYTIVDDCAASGGFFIDVDITDLGSATSLTVSDGTTTMPVTATGVVQFGSYANATDVTITVTNDQDGTCQISSGVLTQAVCPPANDTAAGATPIVPSVQGTGCATFTFTNATGGDGTTDSGLDGTCDTTDTGLDRFYTWTATSLALVYNDGAGNPGIVIREATTPYAEITCTSTFASADTQLSGWAMGQDLIIQIYDYGTADVNTSFCLEQFTPPTCLEPTALSAAVTDTTASLGWTAGGSEIVWNVEWGVDGFTQTAGAMLTGTTNPTSLTGLAPETAYDFYVQANCGGGDLSAWAGPYSFTTSAAAIVPDYLNDFATYPGTGWTEANGPYGAPSGTFSTWGGDDFANNLGHANGNSARVNIYGTSVDEYLISPLFDLSGGTYYLNFDVALTVYNGTSAATLGPDDYVALLVTEDGVTWTELAGLRLDQSVTISETLQAAPEFILTGYSATTRFAFYAFSDTTNEDVDLFMDNFSLSTTTGTLGIANNIIDGFTMYPNPVNNILNFNAQNSIDDISIYNLLGQEVVRTQPNASNTSINMSNLPTGMYVVKVQVGEQLGTYRVVKK